MLNFKQVETQPGYIWIRIASILYTCTDTHKLYYICVQRFFLIFPSSFVTWLQIFVTKQPAETSRSLRKPSPRPFMTLARWSSSCWAHWLWLEDITWNEREHFTVKFSKRRFLLFFFGPLENLVLKVGMKTNRRFFFNDRSKRTAAPLWTSDNQETAQEIIKQEIQ